VNNYAARIMNIPCNSNDYDHKVGHRDARHAAAEIASEAEGRIITLEAEVERLTAELAAERLVLAAWGVERDVANDRIAALEVEVERLEEARDGALLLDRDHLLAAVERLTQQWAKLRTVIRDDAYAATFQALGGYRTALLDAMAQLGTVPPRATLPGEEGTT
jgi:uncharacterized small protein (DUF1192 family)